MKKQASFLISASVLTLLFVQCNNTQTESSTEKTNKFAGFESQVKWGEHLVTIAACHDCHTPKIFTAEGMRLDSSLLLAGHMGFPVPEVNRKEMQEKGYAVVSDLTSWVGPWGISYTANLTSDSTGIGAWNEDQFMIAIREGKFKGIRGARSLLPPMPWEMYRYMKDEELKAIFAYLKSTKPVKNVVPPPAPPVTQ